MKQYFMITLAYLGLLLSIFLSCTNNDALFDPTGDTGITVSAFVCDTTGLDTALLITDILPDTITVLSPYAGQTVTFLGFIKGDSTNTSAITWSWDFGDSGSSLSRIVEHRYMAAGTYKAVFTITNSVGVSLSDTVIISAKGITTLAAVRGYAFFKGKKEHDSIEVLLKSTFTSIPILTAKSGLFEMMSNVPEGEYNAYFSDKKTGEFLPETLANVIITNNILNELGEKTLTRIPPVADAGKDTTVGFGSTINLHGTATDNGSIIKWEWRFGNSPWIVTSSGDTSIVAPLSAQTFVCSLRVTDDDGDVGIDYVNIYLQAIFTPHTITTSADGAKSLFAIDVDGDGNIDMLSASFNDNKIAWYENNGAESFTAHTITASAAIARSVFAVDVDGDSDIDVLSASAGDKKIAWYENDGAENFSSHTITDSAGGACSVYAIDIDGDSDIDVLSASSNDNKIVWYENDGAENFSSHTITDSAYGACSVFAIDIDGDSDIDVLSASFTDNMIAWYENDGTKNFSTHIITTSANGACSVFAIDIDGDNDIDVLSASNDNKIVWYENDGAENFSSYTITDSADGACSVFAIDIDGDSDVDVLSASTFDDKIAWYENDGVENFTAHTITTSADGAFSVYAIDVDGDGDIDLISASLGDDKIAWYENGD